MKTIILFILLLAVPVCAQQPTKEAAKQKAKIEAMKRTTVYKQYRAAMLDLLEKLKAQDAEYVASLERLIPVYEEAVQRAEGVAAELRKQFAKGSIGPALLEMGERQLRDAKEELANAQTRLAAGKGVDRTLSDDQLAADLVLEERNRKEASRNSTYSPSIYSYRYLRRYYPIYYLCYYCW